MASTLKIAVNTRGADRKLDAFIKAAQRPQAVYEVIGNTILNRIRLCFKLGIDPWGNPWTAIKFRAPRTTTDKKGRRRFTAAGREQLAANVSGNPGQPLRDTGRLQRSITSVADANGVTIGTNLIQAPVHQFGATIKPVNAKRLVFPGPAGEMIFAKKVTIPARPFLPLRKNSVAVALPPAWSVLVVRALRTYFLKSIATV